MHEAETTAEMDSRVLKALALMPNAREEAALEEHVRWELRVVLSRLQLADLTTRETMAVLALLCPVHARVIRTYAPKDAGPGAIIHLIR